ncbi:MAG: type I restriction endonuclease [Luteolibacter sp.]
MSEDQIEQAILQRQQFVHGYDVENFFTEDREDLDDGSNRSSKREVILHDRLRATALRLNPNFPESVIYGALKTLCERRRAMPIVAANREVYDLIRDGVRVEFRDAEGKNRVEQVRVIDFKDAEANEFLAVSQMWIQGEVRFSRPDVLLYITGLPLVFIELKNSNVKLRNAIDTRVGSINAGWQHFFRWLRPEDEKEKIDRAKIVSEATSAERLLAGLCAKDKLIDYVENFILYHQESHKIIAQNHQFIGVNKGFARYVERGDDPGKLGVFWHTQGSGKSFSMIFHTRKILRKCGGSLTFLVVTDREDLDGHTCAA